MIWVTKFRGLVFYKITRAEHFSIVDIEIIAWSPLFINLKIILIFSLYPGKLLKLKQIERCFQNPKQTIKSRIIFNFERRKLVEISKKGENRVD